MNSMHCKIPNAGFTDLAREGPAGPIRNWVGVASKRLTRFARQWMRRPEPQLRLCESVTLGERRFVALIQVEKQRFLIGGSSAAVVLLAQLPGIEEAEDAE